MSKICSIGSVPNDFIDLKLKDLADTKVMNSFTDGDWIESKHMSCSGVRLIQTGNIGVGKFIEKDNKKYISEKTFNELKCKEVKEGDILICRLADPIGRSCIIPKINSKLITSVDVALLRINKKYFDNKYINYYFNFEKHLNTINSFASGTTRQRISRGNLGEVKVAVPPLKEQQKIAEILSSVDAAIEKTEQVIAKTEEVKKGLMQQLLTKGIGHTEFKQTKIGEIPLTWDLVKLEEVTQLITKGTTPTTYGYKFEDNGVNFIKVENLRQSINSNELLKISYECHEKLQRSQLQIGDILFSIAGTLGSTYIVDESILPCNTNQALSIIRLKNNVNICYINYVLNSNLIQKEIDGLRTVGAQPNLNLKQVGNFTIPFPPIDEQDRISQIIKKNEEMIYNEIKKLRKLKSLKQGLMQQLLTGQVRVKID